jgi:hypothetical protein
VIPVRVTLAISIDVTQWAERYGLDHTGALGDIRLSTLQAVQDWLSKGRWPDATVTLI